MKLNIRQSFQDILKKYVERNKRDLLSENVIDEMNGVVLFKTCNAIFDFHGVMVDDVKAYCESIGCRKPDKVIFVSSYDIQITNAPNLKMKMQADSKISIIEEDGEIIARVVIGEWVSIRERYAP